MPPNSQQSDELSDDDFYYMCEFMRIKTGVVLGESKRYFINSHLSELATTQQFAVSELVNEVKTGLNKHLEQLCIAALTTNESFFFRDQKPFDLLRDELLPTIIEQKNASGCINIWCGAAATGQEPYSIAMLLHEHFPQLVAAKAVRIIASDVSDVMLQRAQAGVYNSVDMQRGLPKHLQEKYFKQHNNHWEINPMLRELIEFKLINLCQAWPSLPMIDILFLRNVLIYFSVENKSKVFKRLTTVMHHGSFLVLGNGETTIGLSEEFKPAPFDACACYIMK